MSDLSIKGPKDEHKSLRQDIKDTSKSYVFNILVQTLR